MKKNVEVIQNFINKITELPNDIKLSEDKDEMILLKEERGKLFAEMSAILLEIRGFIKIVYGSESEYFDIINKVKYSSTQHGIVMPDNDTRHLVCWLSGKREALNLLQNIEAEEKMKIELSTDKEIPIKYTIAIILFVILMLATWTAPNDTLATYFDETKLIPTKVALSIVIGAALGIIPYKQYWKEFLFSGVIAGIAILLGLMKPTIPTKTTIPVSSASKK